ncbi:2Fe-2S iron-sulfur cluster-binding protein [Sessilibacter corallicola]|uniref:2Fe-2S ferredoxin-type domain-containing protein n=1 Tax=Sessilibacter corallicola TaxID=2904075 RepID=A0ABQ0ACT0_9GAMM
MKTQYRIKVLNRNQEFFCDEETSLLKHFENSKKGGVKIGCRGGGCGVCKIRIVTGEFTCKAMSEAHVTPSDIDEGYVLACRTYPKSHLTIELLNN